MSGGAGLDPASIDDVIHAKVRLSIMAYLSGADAADFTTLKAKLGLTDGNLSVHLSKLEEAGYVRLDRRSTGRRPQTVVTISDAGRAAFAAWLETIAPIVAAAKGGT